MSRKENQELITFNQFKYIADIFECEKTKYILEKREKELINQSNSVYQSPDFESTGFYDNWCKEYKYPKEHLPEQSEPERSVGVGAFLGLSLSGIIPLIIVFSNLGKLNDKDIGPAIALSIIIIPIVGAIIGGVISSISYKKALKEYNNSYIKTNQKIDKDNKKAETFNTRRYSYWLNEFNKSEAERINRLEETELRLINKEINQINKEYINVTDTLNMLYSLRLDGRLCLHPKYQGLIPIAIIYGYFDTGRCDKLEGHEGAYNLYEDEKFKQRIKDSIDYLSIKIDNLNDNMIYVGKAVDECNNQLFFLEENGQKMISAVNSMDKSVNNLSAQVESIEKNTANGAYYSKIGSEMAMFSAYYDFLKN